MSAVASVLAGLTGVSVGAKVVPVAIARAPRGLLRVNVNGAAVPAVLGAPLMAGTVAGLALAALVHRSTRRASAAAVGVIAVTAAGGLVDDALGEEAARGFKGHLGALASGRVTGGTVKIVAGAVAGALAAATSRERRAGIETAATVALTANLVNLLDRAPGRAAKVAWTLATPLVLLGDPSWGPAGAATLGALAACTPADLAARAMLGDAGANPLGAVLGLGLARSLPRPARRTAIAVLVLLTAASERWSFSETIARVPWLRALDDWGTGQRPAPEIPSPRASVK